MGALAETIVTIASRAYKHPFPQPVLAGCETGLLLFSSAFNGSNDGYWLLDAGMTATCVDIDGDKLARMRRFYPDTWEFVKQDAFAFAADTDRSWDFVSVDCPSNLCDRVLDETPLFLRLATRAVTLCTTLASLERHGLEPTCGSVHDHLADTLGDWRVTGLLERASNGCHWIILEH